MDGSVAAGTHPATTVKHREIPQRNPGAGTLGYAVCSQKDLIAAVFAPQTITRGMRLQNGGYESPSGRH